MLKPLLAVIALGAAVFGVYAYLQRATPVQDATADVLAVMTTFGERMQNVPLTADPEVAKEAITEQYRSLVTGMLLAEWRDDPARAPGRRASSPWPVRIEPLTLAQNPDGSYQVTGRVIEITSEELVKGGAAETYDIETQVVKQDKTWRIASFSRL